MTATGRSETTDTPKKLVFPQRIEELLRDAPEPYAFDPGEFFLQQASEVCDQRFPRLFASAEADHPEVLEWVRRYRADPATARSLLLLGVTGAGKTHQAYGALRQAAHQSAPVRWEATTAADLYASLRPRSGVDSEAELERYRKVDLLLVDDLGASRPTEWVEEISYRLINGRYEQQRPMILTSNLALDAFRARLGDRISSRLAEMCTRVILTGPDRRRQRPATASGTQTLSQ